MQYRRRDRVVTTEGKRAKDSAYKQELIEIKGTKGTLRTETVFYFCRNLGPANGPSKIAQPAVFQAVWRGIGKSFQSAITAPRMNLTGYGNATAQSCSTFISHTLWTKTSILALWDVLCITTFLREKYTNPNYNYNLLLTTAGKE